MCIRDRRDGAYSFARIFCNPIAGVENYGEVFVLSARPPSAIPPVPVNPAAAPINPEEKGGQRVRKNKRPAKTH